MGRPSYEMTLGDDALMQISRWYYGRLATSKEIGARFDVRRQDVRRLALAGKALIDKKTQALIDKKTPPDDTSEA